MVMGDVQRMPNGNTIVGYSTRGVIARGQLDGDPCCSSWTLGAGDQFGYIEKRATLYGPPPQ